MNCRTTNRPSATACVLRVFVPCLLLLQLLLATTPANADGGFVGTTAYATVQIPDQRALIHYADGVETLVIDTAFQGAGTNFGWIVPVPAIPTLLETTSGLFPTLGILFQPRVVPRAGDDYEWMLALGAFAFCQVLAFRSTRPLRNALLITLFFVIAGGLLLPALATAKGKGEREEAAVQVLSRQTIGGYEVAILASPNGTALRDWLTRNGFTAPPAFAPVLAAYAREGWTFVAAKLRLNNPLSASAQPAPLGLRFRTEHPVYPLRLTGLGNEHCRIELYVFGPGQAATTVPQFHAADCAIPSYPAPDPNRWPTGDRLRILHPALRQIVNGAPVATHLIGEFRGADMQADAYLTWHPPMEKRTTLYTPMAAWQTTLNQVAPVAVTAFVLAALFRGRSWPTARPLYRCSGNVFLLSLTLLPILALRLPRAGEFRVVRSPQMMNKLLHEVLIPLELKEALPDPAKSAPTPDIAWTRHQLAPNSSLHQSLRPEDQLNQFTGRPWREEDSPGNYTLRATPDGVEYTWYDFDGQPHVTLPFQPANK